MPDTSALWLIEQLRQSKAESALWVCDENNLSLLPNQLQMRQLQLLTNRFDIAQEAISKGFSCVFNDMDFGAFEDKKFDAIFYRISKEKAVCHHVINQAFSALSPNGQLIMCGEKNEGIKTYLEKTAKLFNCPKDIHKDGSNYFSVFHKTTHESAEFLDDQAYRKFQSLTLPSGLTIETKPGQFGWNKCDEGSQLLVEFLNEALPRDLQLEHLIDLGCGYGFLSLETRWINAKQRTLTDNNAAALITAQRNTEAVFTSSTSHVSVVAADAGDQVAKQASLIICNPPFHQGFDVSGDLTDKFLKRAAQLLTKEGLAYFVVNQFIPVPQKASPYFNACDLVHTNKRFSIYRLSKPISIGK